MKILLALVLCAASFAQSHIPLLGVGAAEVSGGGGSSAAQPTDSPGTGSYSTAQGVTLSTSTAGATICYRLDGTNPSATTPGICDSGSITYASSFFIGSNVTLKAIATKAGLTNSSALSSPYGLTSSGSSLSATFHSSTNGGCTASAGTSCTTSSFPVTTGDLIICLGSQTAAATLQALSFQDSASNIYNPLAAARSNGTKANGRMFMAVAGSSASITATVNNVNGTNSVAGTCLALTPNQFVTPVVDTSVDTTFDATTSMVSGSTPTTTNANDLYLSGFAITNDTAGGSITKGGSYDMNTSYSNGGVLNKADAFLQFKNVTTTGSQTGGATNSVSVSGAGLGVALKAPGNLITAVSGQEQGVHDPSTTASVDFTFGGATIAAGNTILCGLSDLSRPTFAGSMFAKSSGTATLGTIVLAKSESTKQTPIAAYFIPVTGSGTLTLTYTPGTGIDYREPFCKVYSGINQSAGVVAAASNFSSVAGTLHSVTISTTGIGMLFYVSSENPNNDFTRSFSDTSVYSVGTGGSTATVGIQSKLINASGSNTMSDCTGATTVLPGGNCATGGDSEEWNALAFFVQSN